ncbi:MAG: response regulator transcription factor [Alphaproteobacteria bacterium]
MNKTVLVIDDDDDLRLTLAQGLRNNNFYAITAESAKEGKNILKKITVNAIILDRMMPEIDGLTFLQELRSSGNKTPVIMLTAMTGSDNTIDGLSGGADDYLGKPFKFQELLLRLNNIIERYNYNKNEQQLLPKGLVFSNGEFFVATPDDNQQKRLLNLSGEEKKLLQNLVTPVGNIVPASPMVAKRLRIKLNNVLSNIDILTIRGLGYKIINL